MQKSIEFIVGVSVALAMAGIAYAEHVSSGGTFVGFVNSPYGLAYGWISAYTTVDHQYNTISFGGMSLLTQDVGFANRPAGWIGCSVVGMIDGVICEYRTDYNQVEFNTGNCRASCGGSKRTGWHRYESASSAEFFTGNGYAKSGWQYSPAIVANR